ncbi:GAP family protein [Yinghuangia sp. ASG 101]|uniref:GAP family protein n=1 Tax=Yinghuangia sp. ASG 101 TaxID=2896848 RepID=UPI001E3C6AAA|nr:GAP family protein [Yinghuangia sp. ASG 101]UGQ13969.1 GAP family protein [Yinghuangia sp. ASG 101]
MGDAIGQVLSPAVGVAISPIPLIAIVLMLATPRGRANGTAFTAGWILALSGAVAALVAVGAGGGADDGGQPATWTWWVKLVVAVLFLLLALKQWRSRPRDGAEPGLPGWMKTVDTFSPAKSAALAFLLAVVNPKNLALVLAAGVSIAGAASTTGERVAAATVFVAIASLCTVVPLAVYLIGGTRAAGVLDGWKTSMAHHNAAIMAVLFLVLGTKLLGDAVGGLAA